MASDEASRAKVFVSYARQDGGALAEELVAALEVLGFDGYLDRHDIAGGEDWEQRLDALIRQADTVVFILTPRSVQSARCDWEVRRAVELSKRMVPVVGVAVPDRDVPAPLQRLNYVHFTAGQSFARALGLLADTLRLDLQWIREHTRIGELAQRWHDRERPEALLLRDDELSSAQAWASEWTPGAPSLTDRQRAYLSASIDADSRRADVERQRNETMARANAERAEALAQREKAVRTLKRRTVLAGLGATGMSAGLAGLALWTLEERRRAEQAERQSVKRAIEAEAGRSDIVGQVVAYAASPGQMAMDSGGVGASNSPYTSALLKELAHEQVSLWTALARASIQVERATDGRQRPFVSSDMNGDLFLRLPSKTRRLRALVIAVGQYESLGLTFQNVYNDGAAWAEFLRGNGFQVTLFRDPTQEVMLKGLADLAIPKRAGAEPAEIRTVGIGRVSRPPPKPEPNSLAVLFYAGYGFRRGNVRYLALSDTLVSKDNTAVDVGAVEQMLRQHAAASVAIYDTQFL